eukprot:TRINITY_DN31029_c0_g1_i1.p1 TRINITY_DN31029_c0_g1~~TRINITY_DN31029_c0_g1_i1.p1  ORF type:complete len:197 (+),score=19.94 TRINITY_DN31029_c0_g1_i1:86-676(+)
MFVRRWSAFRDTSDFLFLWLLCSHVIGNELLGGQNGTFATSGEHVTVADVGPGRKKSVTRTAGALMRREQLGGHKITDHHPLEKPADVPVASLTQLWPHHRKRRRSSWGGTGDSMPRSLLSRRTHGFESCPGTKVLQCSSVMPAQERYCNQFYMSQEGDFVICGSEQTYSATFKDHVWTGRCLDKKDVTPCIEDHR